MIDNKFALFIKLICLFVGDGSLFLVFLAIRENIKELPETLYKGLQVIDIENIVLKREQFLSYYCFLRVFL